MAQSRLCRWARPLRSPDAVQRYEGMRHYVAQAGVVVRLIVLFMFCHLPCVLVTGLELMWRLINGSHERCEGVIVAVLPAWLQCLAAFRHLMLVANAAGNFLLCRQRCKSLSFIEGVG